MTDAEVAELQARRRLFVRLAAHTMTQPDFADLAALYQLSAIRMGDELIAEGEARLARRKNGPE